MMRPHLGTALSLMVLLAACSLHRESSQISLARDVEFELMDRAGTEGELLLLLDVRVRKGAEVNRFLLQLEADGRDLGLAGVSAFGMRLFTLTFTDGMLHFEALPFADLLLPPKELLACLQIVFWPSSDLAQHLPELSLRERPGYREIAPDGKPRISVTYSADGKNIRVLNMAKMYELSMVRLEKPEYSPAGVSAAP